MATLTIDKARTALLVMDYQEGIVAGQPESRRQALLERTSTVLGAAREAGVLVVFVSVRLRSGYPDVSPRNKRSFAAKTAGRLIEGTQAVQIHPAVAPRENEPLVVKRRVGAFSDTDLEVVLRSHDITTLVLAGIATSGVVLTTVRTAADMDYELIVLEDCCGDAQAEVHEMLMGSVFPTQATVARGDDFINAM